MTLEQFKEKVKAYEFAYSVAGYMHPEGFVAKTAHEIAMNAMDVLKAVGESGYREGFNDGDEDSQYDYEPFWDDSDTKKRLDNE